MWGAVSPHLSSLGTKPSTRQVPSSGVFDMQSSVFHQPFTFPSLHPINDADGSEGQDTLLSRVQACARHVPCALLVAQKERSGGSSGRMRAYSAALYRSYPTRLRGHSVHCPLGRNGGRAQSANGSGADGSGRQSPVLCPRRHGRASAIGGRRRGGRGRPAIPTPLRSISSTY
jgi:hypothetical protein